MMKPTHIFVGTLFSIPIISNFGLISSVGLIAATLPDIDLKLKIKHRTITHSIITCLVLGLPLCILHLGLGSVFIFNYLIHLILDTCTTMGVPWLYPISKNRFSLKICRTGGTLDYSLLICSVYAIVELFRRI